MITTKPGKLGEGMGKKAMAGLAQVCECFPEHCNKQEDHGVCWCSPKIIKIGNATITVHNEEQ